VIRNSGSVALPLTSTVIKIGKWHCGLGLSHASDDHEVYLDGVGLGTSGVDAEPVGSNLDTTSIGVINQNPDTDFFEGLIGWSAIWDIDLIYWEIAALAHGRNPRTIRPNRLVWCPPVWGINNPEIDVSGNGHLLKVTGTTYSTDGPPVDPIRRQRAHILQAGIPAAGGLSIPVAMHHYTKNIGAA